MRVKEARRIGKQVATLVHNGYPHAAYQLLVPTLAERTRFPMLERIGEPIGAGPIDSTNAFLELVVHGKTEGGWVVIGAALREQLGRDMPGAFNRARDAIRAAQVWYASDIIGERVPGQALVEYFDAALEQLDPWRWDTSSWVRRSVGVAVHMWAKRSGGDYALQPRAVTLMDFLEPLIPDWNMDAVKGTGWGLKTLGKYYPEALTDWLVERLPGQPRMRAIVRRKAMTYLSEEQRKRVSGQVELDF
jgi:hypothetical protein